MTKVMEFLPELAKGTDLEFVEQNGEILFTAEEVGRQLGYSEPRIAVNKLFNKHRSELKHYSSVTEMVTEAGKRETRVFSEEGVYLLSMLARTNEAKRFRARVALFLRRVRKAKLEAAFQNGMQRGAQAAQAMTPWQRENLNKLLKYLRMGLTQRESALLLGCSRETVYRALKQARFMGAELSS